MHGFDRSLLGAFGSSFVRCHTTNPIEMQSMGIVMNADNAMVKHHGHQEQISLSNSRSHKLCSSFIPLLNENCQKQWVYEIPRFET